MIVILKDKGIYLNLVSNFVKSVNMIKWNDDRIWEHLQNE